MTKCLCAKTFPLIDYCRTPDVLAGLWYDTVWSRFEPDISHTLKNNGNSASQKTKLPPEGLSPSLSMRSVAEARAETIR